MTKEKIHSDFRNKALGEVIDAVEKKKGYKLSREEKRKIKKRTNAIADKVFKDLSDGVMAMVKAKYNVNLHYTDEVKEDEPGNEKG